MRYRILGPLQLSAADGGSVRVSGRRERALLSALLVRANQTVRVDELVEAMWDSPPATARQQVHSTVSRLRALLPDGALVTEPEGYRLAVDAGELDLTEFCRLVEDARRTAAAGDPAGASGLYREALALWSGPALGDIDTRPIAAEAGRLAELRVSVLAERFDAELVTGGAALVPELTGQVADHPYAERLRGQLMIALHRAGRRAEALEVYREGRRRLVEDLGLEPGPDLRAIEQAVLLGDRGLDPVAVPPGGPRPAMLPADLADFCGREAQLSAIASILDERLDTAGRVVLLSGPAGVGKTSLAVRAAHRARAGYADGQLYADLRGADARPAQPLEVLTRFLVALGAEPSAVPAAAAAREERYRSALAGRRVLVVLDNVADEAQVRPLLPGAPDCAVLMTARTRLAGLDGVVRLDIGTLDGAEAVDLLGAAIGDARVAAEPDATARLASLCGGLPLALRIAAARLVALPHWPVERLTRRLADRRLLDELRHGDREVRASIALSLRGLPETTVDAFVRLGLQRGTDLPEWTLEALLEPPAVDADAHLDRLIEARLLEFGGVDKAGQCRVRMHDLTHAYAVELAAATIDPRAGREALTRLAGGWLRLAGAADAALPGRYWPAPPARALRWAPANPANPADPADPADPSGPVASEWWEAERATLVWVVDELVDAGLGVEAAELAALMTNFFEVRGYHDDWRHTHERALTIAEAPTTAALLCRLAMADRFGDRNDAARSRFAEARRLALEAGDAHTAALAAAGLGTVERYSGRVSSARECFGAAAREFASSGDQLRLASTRYSAAIMDFSAGRYADALAVWDECRAVFAEAGDRIAEARALSAGGAAMMRLDDAAGAERRLREACRISVEVGARLHLAYARSSLGELYCRQGRPAEGMALLDWCVRAFRDIPDLSGEAMVLRQLAEARSAGGDHLAAMDLAHESIAVATRVGASQLRGQGLLALGDICAAAGDDEGTRAAWSAAVVTLRQLGSPEADAAQARLNDRSENASCSTST